PCHGPACPGLGPVSSGVCLRQGTTPTERGETQERGRQRDGCVPPSLPVVVLPLSINQLRIELQSTTNRINRLIQPRHNRSNRAATGTPSPPRASTVDTRSATRRTITIETVTKIFGQKYLPTAPQGCHPLPHPLATPQGAGGQAEHACPHERFPDSTGPLRCHEHPTPTHSNTPTTSIPADRLTGRTPV